MIATTHPMLSVREAVLFVAFELGKKDWKLAMTSGFGVTRSVLVDTTNRRQGGREVPMARRRYVRYL
jgi:hypothetical protein